MRKGGRTEKRIRRWQWRLTRPSVAENFGVRLPLDPAIPEGIRRQMFLGEYEASEAEIVGRRLAPGDVVMEVGAGIGFLSALCARTVGGDRVHAYEANPALEPIIRRTWQLNGVSPTLAVAMLGEGAGEQAFFVEPDFWASSTIRRSAAAREVRVARRDLNEELRRVQPTFLIVDIEGGEAELFAQADLGGVAKLCVEVHPDVLGNDGATRLFAGLFAKGLVLDFSCIRKNVFFFHRTGAGRAP